MSGRFVVPVNCLARFIRKTGPARNSRRKLVRKIDVFLRREHLLDLPKLLGVCVEHAELTSGHGIEDAADCHSREQKRDTCENAEIEYSASLKMVSLCMPTLLKHLRAIR